MLSKKLIREDVAPPHKGMEQCLALAKDKACNIVNRLGCKELRKVSIPHGTKLNEGYKSIIHIHNGQFLICRLLTGNLSYLDLNNVPNHTRLS